MNLMQFFFILLAFFLSPFLLKETYAAKAVPTFKIEIPGKKQKLEENQDFDTSPSIPFSDEDFKTSPSPETEDETPETFNEETEIKDVTVFYDDKDLPEAVRQTRQKLLEIAREGDIEKLRALFESFDNIPLLSFEEEEEPIEFLKSQSGDGEGREILAIMLEVLESGYVRRHKDEEGDIFIWPYFVDIPPQNLKPAQQVELFRLITAGDFEDMQAYGTYIFYRAGITPDGQLKFFLAGD